MFGLSWTIRSISNRIDMNGTPNTKFFSAQQTIRFYGKYSFNNGTAHFKNVNNCLNTNIYSYLVRDIWWSKF